MVDFFIFLYYQISIYKYKSKCYGLPFLYILWYQILNIAKLMFLWLLKLISAYNEFYVLKNMQYEIQRNKFIAQPHLLRADSKFLQIVSCEQKTY